MDQYRLMTGGWDVEDAFHGSIPTYDGWVGCRGRISWIYTDLCLIGSTSDSRWQTIIICRLLLLLLLLLLLFEGD